MRIRPVFGCMVAWIDMSPTKDFRWFKLIWSLLYGDNLRQIVRRLMLYRWRRWKAVQIIASIINHQHFVTHVCNSRHSEYILHEYASKLYDTQKAEITWANFYEDDYWQPVFATKRFLEFIPFTWEKSRLGKRARVDSRTLLKLYIDKKQK